jgi:hypothetical protein
MTCRKATKKKSENFFSPQTLTCGIEASFAKKLRTRIHKDTGCVVYSVPQRIDHASLNLLSNPPSEAKTSVFGRCLTVAQTQASQPFPRIDQRDAAASYGLPYPLRGPTHRNLQYL